MQKIFTKNNKFTTRIFIIFVFFFIPYLVKADVLAPGNISTCGELAAPGTYTLTQNLSGVSSTCFVISSNNVVIDGAGHTISGSGSTAIDGRAYTSLVLTVGANGYTNLVINDLNITGYTTGVDISGNTDSTGSGVNNGYGGDGGDVAIYYSNLGSVLTTGGNSSTKNYGGLGGNISFNNTDLDISNITISALAGSGTVGKNTDGGLDLNYSGLLGKTGVTLSPFSFFNDNAISYGVYPGGTWPISQGSISGCGTLYSTSSAVFTLTQNISGVTGSCFTIFGNNVTIDGAGYSITSATTTNTLPAILAGNYSSTTLQNLGTTNFQNLITSSSSVIISGNSVNLSSKKVSANNLSIQAGSLNLATTTVYANVLNINYTSSVSGTSTASSSALTSLIINSFNYGPKISGIIFSQSITARTSVNRSWRSVTSSSDGKKLAAVVEGGQIYTSTDYGVTWTARESNRLWKSISSSADGTKLTAVVYGGKIYTSTDSGITWTARDSNRNWFAITSSVDGKKLAAAASSSQIYTSTDSGVTWTARDSNRAWSSIASSADGTKLVATVQNGQIYTSTDSGVTWTARDSNRDWRSIASSADGVKLSAVEYSGQIYTSINSGVNWTARYSGGGGFSAVSSSADGTRLVAGNVYSTYYSVDSGINWLQYSSDFIKSQSISLSADGMRFVVVADNGLIYTYSDLPQTISVDILSPSSSNVISTWSPYVSWGVSTSCYYSYDNFVSTSTANCSLAGSDISPPSNGSATLYVKGINTTGNLEINSISFTYTDQDILINSPYVNTTYSSVNWSPSINYSISNQTLISCYYSYDNFVSTSTANCSLAGSDISPPVNGSATLYIKTIDSISNVEINSVLFNYTNQDILINSPYISSTYSVSTWSPSVKYSISNQTLTSCYYSYNNFVSTSTSNCSLNGSDISTPIAGGSVTLYIKTISNSNTVSTTSSVFTYQSDFIQMSETRAWQAITSSADGVKLAAVTESGKIYTSTDSGVSWTSRNINRDWKSIASSADGTKLVAVVNAGQIYTSTDSGVNWTARDSSRNWRSVASSADGTKLVAVVNTGQIYTSTDSGITWTARNSSRAWTSVASSADGVKLVATVSSGQIYTSTDSGANWTARDSSRVWNSVASSLDGTKLVATVSSGQIYTSINSGSSWTARDSSRAWKAVTSSADGVKLAAVVDSGQIYTSINSGSSWTATESNRLWNSITSSADGNKIIATTNRFFNSFADCVCISTGYVYTYTNPFPTLSVDIENPTESSVISNWSPYVSWGVSTSCYYSYNNFVSTSTANCALNGSDISPPSAVGASTLYVKGLYNGSIDTDSKSFTYSKFYWCGTVNNSWSTAGNWYTTSSCSVNTGSVPGITNEAILVGTTSPIINASTTLPFLINSSGLTGAASTTGIIFASSTYNTTTIIGNTTFYDTSYNVGSITGNVYFNSASAGALILSGGMRLAGSISGTIKGGDSVDINNIVFNNSSTNEMTLGTGINVVFNNAASNTGTINGNVVFNNTSPFTIGTVNGTVTLNGLAQTIQGINNVTNLTKQSVNKDTLYLTSASVLNISGLLVLTGYNADNLLTLRSTIPGISSTLGLNGSETMNFLRIKDINNTSSLTDLSGQTVYDDGGNIGFGFPVNSTPSVRPTVTGSYVVPNVPSSHLPVLPSMSLGQTISGLYFGQSATIDRFFIKNIKSVLVNVNNTTQTKIIKSIKKSGNKVVDKIVIGNSKYKNLPKTVVNEKLDNSKNDVVKKVTEVVNVENVQDEKRPTFFEWIIQTVKGWFR